MKEKLRDHFSPQKQKISNLNNQILMCHWKQCRAPQTLFMSAMEMSRKKKLFG